MNDLDNVVFSSLFKDACRKCFGYPVESPLTETESKQLYNKIFEQTGLVVGWKSIKNYSSFLFNGSAGKQENPSIATLDTLARYVLDAPYTDETSRKGKENHYPWWFSYKDKIVKDSQKGGPPRKVPIRFIIPALVALAVIVLLSLYLVRNPNKTAAQFTDDFHSISTESLQQKGWWVQRLDTVWWQRRNAAPGSLTFFTLEGDNWPDSNHAPGIRNLLLRKINAGCFTAEIHLAGFLPLQNWQQAGILLLEDTSFKGRSVRLSVMYNDYSGGFAQHKEILVQAITSLGQGFGKPEEISHVPLFSLDCNAAVPTIRKNLEHLALRIEKQGRKFRFLFADGPLENSAFKEAGSHEFDMTPKFIGLFALKGFVENADNIPASFRFFSLSESNCH